MEQPQYLTRAGIVELARARGIPLTLSRIEKDACIGRGPEVAATFGNRKLSTPQQAAAYIDSKIVVAAAPLDEACFES